MITALHSVDMSASHDYLRTDFLVRIAHDLRGPAGVSLGALEEMELSLDAAAQASVAPFLSMARRSVNRILRLAETLHRSAELAGGSVVWEKTLTDLSELIAQAVDSVEPRQGIHLRILGERSPCVFPLDPGWFQYAIAELLAAAMEHARREVAIEISVNDAGISVIVSDDGRAALPEHVARFSPPRDRSGIGLGMPLVWDVVHAHGGNMQVFPAIGLPAEATIEMQESHIAMSRVLVVLPGRIVLEAT